MKLDKDKQKEKREIRLTATKLELREVNDEGGTTRTITGSIKYNSESEVMRDWWGDQFVEEIAAGAFNESLAARAVVALWSHRTDMVLGNTKSSTLRINNTDGSLDFEMDLPATRAGDDAYESIKRGDVDGVSFGMKVSKDKWSQVERDGGKIYKRSILNAELYEISPVAFPAYPANEVSCRSLESYREELKKQSLENRKRILNLELELI